MTYWQIYPIEIFEKEVTKKNGEHWVNLVVVVVVVVIVVVVVVVIIDVVVVGEN